MGRQSHSSSYHGKEEQLQEFAEWSSHSASLDREINVAESRASDLKAVKDQRDADFVKIQAQLEDRSHLLHGAQEKLAALEAKKASESRDLLALKSSGSISLEDAGVGILAIQSLRRRIDAQAGIVEVESSFTLSTKLTAEGPTRMKEEYVEGLVSSPSVSEVPSQLKSVYDQIVAAAERLPAAVKDVVSNGIKVPLTGSFERQLLISFLDEEILVARDEFGVPDILYKIRAAVPVVETVTVVPEYLS